MGQEITPILLDRRILNNAEDIPDGVIGRPCPIETRRIFLELGEHGLSRGLLVFAHCSRRIELAHNIHDP